MTKAEDTIERYLSAFESGTLSEAQCAKRLEGLATKVRDLRQRREELVVAVQQASATAPDAEVIDEMRHHIEHTLPSGALPARGAPPGARPRDPRRRSRPRCTVVPRARRRGPAGSRPGAFGAPGRSRTRNLVGRSHPLYPVELRRQVTDEIGAVPGPETADGARLSMCRVRRQRPAPRGSLPLAAPLVQLCHAEGTVVAVAQLVRAPGCGPGGRGFKSPRSPSFLPPFAGRAGLRSPANGKDRCAGTSVVSRTLDGAPLAQWQSNGLLIRRLGVRIPRGARKGPR